MMEITFMLYKSNGLTHYQYRLGSSYEYKSKTNLQTKMMVKGNIFFLNCRTPLMCRFLRKV